MPFIESNTCSQCVHHLFWGQEFQKKALSIILSKFTSRIPHLNGYRSTSWIIIYTCSLQEVGLTDLID